MKTRNRILLIELIAVVLGGFAWVVVHQSQQPEPSYQGKPPRFARVALSLLLFFDFDLTFAFEQLSPCTKAISKFNAAFVAEPFDHGRRTFINAVK